MTLDDFMMIANIQVAVYLVAGVIAIINFRARQLYVKLLGLFGFVPLIAQVASMALYSLGINPNYASSSYTIVAFNLISLIYYHVFEKKYASTFFITALFFTLFAVVNFFFIQKTEINSYTLMLESLLGLGYVLFYFYWLMRELPTTDIQRLPMFWINSGWLIYFSGNFFLYSSTSYLVNVLNNDMLLYWTIHNVLSAFFAIMMILALWIDLRNIRLRSS
jgi:hypothetical protein